MHAIHAYRPKLIVKTLLWGELIKCLKHKMIFFEVFKFNVETLMNT
jgi:hypothetical protein